MTAKSFTQVSLSSVPLGVLRSYLSSHQTPDPRRLFHISYLPPTYRMLPEFQKAVTCPLMQGCRLILCDSLRRPAWQEVGGLQCITCPLHAWGVHCPGPCLDAHPPPPSALSEIPLYHRLPPGCHSDWTEAPGLNTGGLLWMHTAPRSGPSPQVQPWYAVAPPCLQILKSHTWDALHLG